MTDTRDDIREAAEGIVCEFIRGKHPEVTHAEMIDAIEAALRAAYARGLEDAAKVAEADHAQECPYDNDKPGDPTWKHTDDDICPVCKVSGRDSFSACVGVSRSRIAAAIRAKKGTEG